MLELSQQHLGHSHSMLPPKKKRRVDNATAIASKVTSEENNEDATKNSISLRPTNLKASNSLYVRGLPPTTGSKDLEALFSQTYPVKHATAVLNPETGLCRGFGFVSFVESEDAENVKKGLDGSDYKGARLKITSAKLRNRRENDDERSKNERSELNGSSRVIQPSKLIIRNLPWEVKKADDLAILFRSFGKIKNITIPSKPGGLMSGYAFVTMRGRKNATKAMESVNGKELHGRTLAVDWAVDRDQWQEHGKNKSDGKDIEEADLGNENHATLSDDESHRILAEQYSDPGEASEKSYQSDMTQESMSIEPKDAVGDGRRENQSPINDNESTLFIRNVPFVCMDEDLYHHFEQFGPIRYARVVSDPSTNQSKGTAFVRFVRTLDAKSCLASAPKLNRDNGVSINGASTKATAHSIIQDETIDTDGRFTMDGRIFQVSQAVDRTEAARLRDKSASLKNQRERDKRRLYLLSEGVIPSNSPLYQQLSNAEIAIREASAKQRKAMIEKNPSLHLSLTRLSIRNIPRHVTSKDLKILARDAIVGFATDVREGVREKLSKEELGRAVDEMRQNERERKLKGKGLVKQAKVIYEGSEGSKVREESGGGRSRGYGFIEYYTHRNALMGLRWLNGHAVKLPEDRQRDKRLSKADVEEKTRRLVAEFAIENAQVLRTRKGRESSFRQKRDSKNEPLSSERSDLGRKDIGKDRKLNKGGKTSKDSSGAVQEKTSEEAEKLAKRSRIIARKRTARRMKAKRSI